MSWTVQRYHWTARSRDGKGIESEQSIVLACERREKLRLLTIRGTVKVLRVPKTEGRYLKPVQHHGAPYPLARAVRRFRRAGRKLGITKGARKVLRSLEN